MALFLRSDIFDSIMAYAREPDKINFHRIRWSDRDMLKRVIDLRFTRGDEGIRAVNVWDRFFCKKVKQTSTIDYVIGAVLPRPRDIVFLVKAAIDIAVNKGHEKVEESDILAAEREYSAFAFESVKVEDDLPGRKLGEIFYQMMGKPAIMEERAFLKDMNAAGVLDADIAAQLEQMCVLGILGVEVKKNQFRFSEDDGDYKRNRALADTLAVQQNSQRRYKLNRAFWAFLETDPTT